MTAAAASATLEDAGGERTLTARMCRVVGERPKRRNESAICVFDVCEKESLA